MCKVIVLVILLSSFSADKPWCHLSVNEFYVSQSKKATELLGYLPTTAQKADEMFGSC